MVTGLARRTSGAFGITPAAATGLGAIVGAAGAAGATDGPPATLLGDVPAGAGVVALEASAGETLGDVCVVACVGAGASRCTLRTNFISKKPITNTTTPTMSGIGEIRLLRATAGRRGTTGALAGFSGRFSWRYE